MIRSYSYDSKHVSISCSVSWSATFKSSELDILILSVGMERHFVLLPVKVVDDIIFSSGTEDPNQQVCTNVSASRLFS